MKRAASESVEEKEDVSEVPFVVQELLDQLPSEQHSQVLAIVHAEPQRYNSQQAFVDLVASIQAQIAASIQVTGAFEAEDGARASSAALQPFRKQPKGHTAKCQCNTRSENMRFCSLPDRGRFMKKAGLSKMILGH